jgi:hypothetical protein
VATVYNPQIVTNGLVLCLDAANPKSYPGSGTVVADLSGFNNNANLINGTSFSNQNNGGFVCDGVDDYINITENQNMKPQILTAEVAVKINSHTNVGFGGDPTFQYILFRQNSRTGNFEGYVINYIESTANFSCGATPSNGTPQYGITSANNSVVLGRPYIVTAVFDTTMMYLYINGVLVNSGIKASGIDYNASHTLKIGRSVPIDNTFDAASPATFYSIKIYNRALSSFEISQNFNALRGRFGV